MTGTNILIGILIVIAILFGGYYLFVHPAPATAPTTTTVTTTTPTPTPANPSNTPAAPQVITDPSAVSIYSSGAIVTGKVSPNGAPTTYWYDYGTTNALSSRSAVQTLGSGYTALPAPAYISGLSSNTTYYYRLSAKNALGTANGQTYMFTTNTTPPVTGIAPTTRTSAATAITRTSANLNGSLNPNGAASSYWFEWGTTPDLGIATALQSAGSGSSLMNVSASLSDLNPLTKYYFRLNTQNKYGTVNGSVLSFTTVGPGAPGVPTVSTNAATSIATSSAVLNGHVNPNGDPTQYWFEYGVDSLLGSLVGQSTKTAVAGSGTSNVAVSASVDTLHPATKYYFRTVAQNSQGTSRGSISSFTTH